MRKHAGLALMDVSRHGHVFIGALTLFIMVVSDTHHEVMDLTSLNRFEDWLLLSDQVDASILASLGHVA